MDMDIVVRERSVIMVDGGSDGELRYKPMRNVPLELSPTCSGGFRFKSLAAAVSCRELMRTCGYNAHVMTYNHV